MDQRLVATTPTASPAPPTDAKPFAITELDYELPTDRIAQHPLPRRDGSRLLVLNRQTGELRDDQVAHLPHLLRRGDLLVLNDTRVVPARFSARRATGGRIDGLFLKEDGIGAWQVMLEHSARLKEGERLTVEVPRYPVSKSVDSSPVTLDLHERRGEGVWCVSVEPGRPAEDLLARIGRTPLPPYIHRPADAGDLDAADQAAYQTVYARRPGAIAAPTAGLHLTNELLQQLRDRGIETAFVTLHVGVGTFAPIRADDLAMHVMHGERFEVGTEAADAVHRCRQRGGRVITVGTTSVRVLESVAANAPVERGVAAASGNTDLFIYPAFTFRVVDGLLTNFHLPRSTLLALVMAFAGIDPVRRAYAHAIAQRYRFYSYGDAMLIV